MEDQPEDADTEAQEHMTPDNVEADVDDNEEIVKEVEDLDRKVTLLTEANAELEQERDQLVANQVCWSAWDVTDNHRYYYVFVCTSV